MILFSRKRESDYQELENNDYDTPKHSRSSRQTPYYFSLFLALGWATTLLLYWHLSVATSKRYTPLPSEVYHTTPKIYHHDDYWSGRSWETQSHWSKQFAGFGALWVEDPKRYGLPKGIEAEFDHPHKQEMADSRFYVVSKLHELHCLSLIRGHWWLAINGRNTSEIHNADNRDVHVDHCFEYLRQAITCGGGDIVLEGASPLGEATSVSGWGREHKCIDFDALADYQVRQEARYNLTWASRDL